MQRLVLLVLPIFRAPGQVHAGKGNLPCSQEAEAGLSRLMHTPARFPVGPKRGLTVLFAFLRLP